MATQMKISDEKGAVAVLVAVMLVLILACLALVVDLGHLHNVKAQLQRAVDAAALAGAAQLGTGSTVRDVAIVTAAANIVDAEPVTIAPEDVLLGLWDKEALGASAASRFALAGAGETANAVKVTARRSVENIFFAFTSGTSVVADAIAVAKPQVPVLPLAIVTCIPADKMLENPGSLPGTEPCDIKSYGFTPDREDSTAWTSLTFTPSANEIVDYMSTPEGREKFNKVVFGTGLENTYGIENEPVTVGGCDPDGFDISCGLGRISAGQDMAPASVFPAPPGLPALSATPGGTAGSFDPLTGFGLNGALPRWYNLSDDGVFGSDDYFTRVWSQDGILIKGAGETIAHYLDRLKGYAECSDASCKPYGDDRFLNGNLIIQPKNQLAKNLKATLGFTPEYWPDFREAISRAGYPKIGVTNGSVSSVLRAFVENRDVTDGTDLVCRDNAPFPAGQRTLRVNAPVIFAGACEDWKAISNNGENHTLNYIGLSKFLLTRLWTNHGDFDCGTQSEVVRLPDGASCSAADFDPTLYGSRYFSLPVNSKNFVGLEGLTLVPVADDEKEQGSLLQAYLVE